MDIHYQNYLKSEKWTKIKKLVFKRDKYICQGCLTETKNLQAHHLTYERIYNEMCFDLITLCRQCHSKIHNIDCVDKYLENYKPNKDETIHRLNNSIFVGYKNESEKIIKEFMQLLHNENINSYFAFEHTGTIFISSLAFEKYKNIFGLNYKEILNIEEYKL